MITRSDNVPTIKEKIIFNYDGKWSDTFGLMNINLDSGMFDESLVASRSIIESSNKGNDRPLFQGFQNEPLEFEMSIAFTEKFTDEKLSDIIDWLFQGFYKPLYFEGREDRIFYCTPIGEPRIVHNGLKEGYFTLTMRCDSAFVYSPVLISQIYDLSDGKSKTIELFNEGFDNLYPEISIDKIGSGSVSFQNITDSGLIWEIRNLGDKEQVYIDCKKGIIKSNMEDLGVYHYEDTSGNLIRLLKGRNTLIISGKCKVQFRYRYKYRF